MKGKKGNKPKRSAEKTEDGVDSSNEAEDTNISKKGSKRTQRKSLEGKPKAGKSSKKSSFDETAFDLSALKKRREALDGSFKKARKNLTQLGPWKLPEKIEDKFEEVAIGILSKMNR